MHKWLVVAGILVLARGSFGQPPNPDAIELVKSGKIQAAKASWWGFEAEDSTEALQAAIDSGVKRLTVDNVGKPWIVRPVSLASNQTIVFQPGVEVVAKEGEFVGTGDCLFRASEKEYITLIGYGAILRMRRADYDNGALYRKGEWRHALSILGCSNIKVYGLTLAESGGDGIYLGKSGSKSITNKNIHIRHVTCDRNYRQGISVITAENLLIENCVLKNTAGTPPEAGIDFEPNSPDERLVNVVVRNCLTRNNKGDGYEVALFHLHESSEPISIRFEDCRSVGDMRGIRVLSSNKPGMVVNGSVEFVRCRIEWSVSSGLVFWNKPMNGFGVKFTDCKFMDSAAGRPGSTPILLLSGHETSEPLGGFEFINCTVRDSLDRNLMSYATDGAARLPVQGITGDIRVLSDGEDELLRITPAHLAAWVAPE